MNNPYTASFEDIRSLYTDYHGRKTRERFDKWKQTLSREEIEKQLDEKSGAVMEEINAVIKEEARRSEAVEFVCALQLADFYFPNSEKEVSFELRRDVDPGAIKTFEDLLASFDDHTHIDCLVRSGDSEISFQLKRYRGDNTPEAFVEWLNTRVLKHYGKMNGTSLVVLLQSGDTQGAPLALDKLYDLFVKDALPNVSFDVVSLMYNDASSGYMALHELHPKHRRRLIELDLMLARMRGDA